jgi:hypothetical protein
MALDWCILCPSGAPDMTVPVEMDVHSALFSQAAGVNLLDRARDYHKDADYTAGEIAGLLQELRTRAAGADSDSGTVLARLERLCEEALRRGCGISVLAD